jgi:hypothetical protein
MTAEEILIMVGVAKGEETIQKAAGMTDVMIPTALEVGMTTATTGGEEETETTIHDQGTGIYLLDRKISLNV